MLQIEKYPLFFEWLQINEFDYPYQKTTIYTYKRLIVNFIGFMAKNHIHHLNEINSAILRKFIKYKENGEKYEKNTINKRKAAVDLFFAWATLNNLCSENPIKAYTESEKEQKSYGGRGGNKPLRLYPVLSLAEIDKVNEISAHGDGFNQMRDSFYIGLLLASGIRVDESTQLVKPLFHFAEGRFKIRGKGNKERIVHIIDKDTLANAYEAYLIRREEKLNQLGLQSDILFITNRGTPLTKRLAYQQVARYLTLAEVKAERVGPHTLRHTAASLMYHHKNIAITTIQKNFGHSKLETTMRYLHAIPKA